MPDLYLGKSFNPADRSLGDRFLLDPSDLTTHGIVIGMTGSGKTGLAISLIEEALRAKVPVIVVDPKGDMGNLALAFDRLAPEQFEPWVDRDEAARDGKTPADFAAAASATWRKGLSEWGLAEADVASYAASRSVRIFTPGATSGIPINLIDSLDAPDLSWDDAEEEIRDEIDSIVTALLGFVKIDADPISSREYILLFSLIEHAWRAGEDLDVESLIGQVASPPFEKVGALPLEAFYSKKERTALMFALNNLVASPPFQVWRKGERIDIESWVRPADGRPQLSIVSTAHLNDEQRIFVTAFLLNKLKSWMRKQPGTSELRCLFYMDEIFGYFPPTANPPTKKPLLTLLKQARAYGVGILLSTQNPVDLDYKGLGNMGFWAIGRLQTAQDQARIREGIEAALADAPDGADFEKLIAGVQKRVFLIHDIHRKAPALVHSRWAMSYLRGPITRDELKGLGEAVAWEADGAPATRTAPARARKETKANEEPEPIARRKAATAPPAPEGLRVRYLNRHGGEVGTPHVVIKLAARYKAGAVAGDEFRRTLGFRVAAEASPAELLESEAVEIDDDELAANADTELTFGELPAWLLEGGAKAVERACRERLDDVLATEILYDPVSKKLATPGEDEAAFAARLTGLQGSSAKRQTLETRLAKKRNDLRLKEHELSGRRVEKWASIGTSILGNIGLFQGKKKTVTGLGGVLSKNRMEGTTARRKDALGDEIEALEAQLAELGDVDPARFERRVLKPTKTDISVLRYDLVWVY